MIAGVLRINFIENILVIDWQGDGLFFHFKLSIILKRLWPRWWEMSSIIRVKKNANYFSASNIPFNDKRLSWEARGVMGYLLSKPDDWTVRFNDLVGNGPAGQKKIRRILKELEKAKKFERNLIKSTGGKFDWES